MIPANPDDETETFRAVVSFRRHSSSDLALSAVERLSGATASRLLDALGWADLRQIRAIDQLLEHHGAHAGDPQCCERGLNSLLDLIEEVEYRPSLRPWRDAPVSPPAEGKLRSA